MANEVIYKAQEVGLYSSIGIIISIN